ncbi:hypothetical protein A5641_19355 [Mycobacterium sp. 1554424.7]|nr:hypothetical protein A5641_19355 [Mycobacterium sp. 1554424.7]
MLWHAMPPELNTARLMAGAGPAPMLQAAASWEALGTALETQAAELAASLVSLRALWSGASSERAIAAATPMVTWLQAVAQLAQRRGAQARAQAASYVKALGTTPSLPEIAMNHISHAVLTATNFLGINLVPIGFNEVDYFVRMWGQAATAIDVYQAESIANTTFEPPPPMKPIMQPEVGLVAESPAFAKFSEMVSQAAPAALRTLSDIDDDIPTATPDVDVPADGLDRLLGHSGPPMQQLMQPLQQLTSMASQTGNMGGTGGTPGGDNLGETELEQVGLLGASPLSNHPLAGGSGPSVGLGLMHAESLPGAGGSESRTSLMTSLIDKPAHAGAGAGSSAVGGAAPMGMSGYGGQTRGGSKPELAAPVMLAEPEDENAHGDVDDQDDW